MTVCFSCTRYGVVVVRSMVPRSPDVPLVALQDACQVAVVSMARSRVGAENRYLQPSDRSGSGRYGVPALAHTILWWSSREVTSVAVDGRTSWVVFTTSAVTVMVIPAAEADAVCRV